MRRNLRLCLIFVVVLGARGYAAEPDSNGQEGAPDPTGRTATLLGELPLIFSDGVFYAPITSPKVKSQIGLYHASHMVNGVEVPGAGPATCYAGTVQVPCTANPAITSSTRSAIWNYDFGGHGTVSFDAKLWFANAAPASAPPGTISYGRGQMISGTGAYAHSDGYLEMYFLTNSYCICYWVLTNKGDGAHPAGAPALTAEQMMEMEAWMTPWSLL
jgi:hypothetical protein